MTAKSLQGGGFMLRAAVNILNESYMWQLYNKELRAEYIMICINLSYESNCTLLAMGIS